MTQCLPGTGTRCDPLGRFPPLRPSAPLQWILANIQTFCLPVALYTLLGFIQMTVWAKGKHRAYSREFKDYPSLRVAIIPLVL